MAAPEQHDSVDAAAEPQGHWRRAGFREIGRIAAELRNAEFRYVPFTARLRSERWAQRVVPVRGALDAHLLRGGGWQILFDTALPFTSEPAAEQRRDSGDGSERLRGSAVMVTATGLVLPALGGAGSLPAQFAAALAATHGQVYSIMGTGEDVRLVEEAVRRPIGTSVDYLLMTLDAGKLRVPGEAADTQELRFHRGSPTDTGRLFELQRGYEIEEVLLRPARFNADNCRRHLRQALRKELVLYATRRGRPVAKAGTNYRGFSVDMVGGVYTLPELRSRGIGAAMMGALLQRIFAAGRSASLFVKPHNAAALRLYEKLGFVVRGDYRIAYYFE